MTKMKTTCDLCGDQYYRFDQQHPVCVACCNQLKAGLTPIVCIGCRNRHGHSAALQWGEPEALGIGELVAEIAGLAEHARPFLLLSSCPGCATGVPNEEFSTLYGSIVDGLRYPERLRKLGEA